MAKVVRKNLAPDRPAARYDWPCWLDGRAWEFRQGRDFHTLARSFTALAHQAAKRAGKKLRTSIDGDRVTIQAFQIEEQS